MRPICGVEKRPETVTRAGGAWCAVGLSRGGLDPFRTSPRAGARGVVRCVEWLPLRPPARRRCRAGRGSTLRGCSKSDPRVDDVCGSEGALEFVADIVVGADEPVAFSRRNRKVAAGQVRVGEVERCYEALDACRQG